jgi:hypothetical protein
MPCAGLRNIALNNPETTSRRLSMCAILTVVVATLVAIDPPDFVAHCSNDSQVDGRYCSHLQSSIVVNNDTRNVRRSPLDDGIGHTLVLVPEEIGIQRDTNKRPSSIFPISNAVSQQRGRAGCDQYRPHICESFFGVQVEFRCRDIGSGGSIIQIMFDRHWRLENRPSTRQESR